jgi:tetratricopeptide (TPR) repeat protein
MTNPERFHLAITLQEQGKYEECLAELEALSVIETENDWKRTLLQNQATCLWNLGRVREARLRIQAAMVFGSTAALEFMDARLSYFEGDLGAALPKLIAFLEKHRDLKNDPDNAVLYFDAREQMGHCLFELGRLPEAASEFNEALPLLKGDRRKRVCHRLGLCCVEAGEPQSAEAWFLESLPEDRNDPWWTYGQYQLGCLYFRKGAVLKAKAAFEQCQTESILVEPEYRRNIVAWLAKLRADARLIQ